MLDTSVKSYDYEFIARMDADKDTTFVVYAECSTGLRMVLDITDDFSHAYGSAMKHIYFCESKMLRDPYVIEGEDGICIPYVYLDRDETEYTDGNITKDIDYIFILRYNSKSCNEKDNTSDEQCDILDSARKIKDYCNHTRCGKCEFFSKEFKKCNLVTKMDLNFNNVPRDWKI